MKAPNNLLPAFGRGLPLWAVLLGAMVMLMLPPFDAAVRAVDRAALGRVLATLPPNGPFWEYGNVTMRMRTGKAGIAPVTFPHWVHRARYSCRVCHVELGFGMRRGSSGISRSQYLAGAFCGACHDGKTAFTARDRKGAQCDRCHIEDTSGLQQRFEVFAAGLPPANFGNGIDWALAQRERLIEPVRSLRQSAAIMQLPERLETPLKLGTTSPRSDVSFSHEEHFAELDCSNCHPDLFTIQRKGTESFSMDNNIYGYYCGACHMMVAFPMNDCRRCHANMQNMPGF